MKNKNFERLQKMAKDHAKKWDPSNAILGVNVPHCHAVRPSPALSYWEDFSFKAGQQVISVWWVHPRMKLMDKIEELAYEAIEKEDREGNAPEFKFLEESTPNYKKTGKSRKKIVSYGFKINPQFDSVGRQERILREKIRLLNSEEVSVKPSIEIHQYKWCRGVSLCFPVELLSDNDIVAFAHRVKQHILRKENLFDAEEALQEYTCAQLRSEYPNWLTC